MLDGWTTVAAALNRVTRPQPAHDPQPLVTATFRVVVVGVASVILLVTQHNPWDAAWAVPLLVPELVIRGRLLPDRSMAALALWWTAVSAVAVCFTGGSHSPLQACIAVAAFLAGMAAGRPAVLQTVGLAGVLLVGTGRLASPQWAGESAGTYLGGGAQWVLIASVVGLVATRLGRTEPYPSPESAGQHAEARALLEQLRAVTSRLPGSLDVASTAELMLDACLRVAGVTVGAVLVHAGDGYHVPLALRGLHRIPWRSPAAESGPLREAWRAAAPVIDLRLPDPRRAPEHGPGQERSGSALLVVPVLSGAEVIGLVALQSNTLDHFTEQVVADVREAVARRALQLETAQTFERLRSAVTVEERSRLARDMHDGVAQDLAYIGFELDFVRTAAARVDEGLAESLSRVRGETTRIISDLRACITDLRSSSSLERGLGAALTSFVRNVGASGPMAIHLTLEESAFRLPGEIEVELLRVAHEFATSARHRGGAGNLWVQLSVEPPAARLRLEHDGTTVEGLRALEHADSRLSPHGGHVQVAPRPGGGLVVEAVVEGGIACRSMSCSSTIMT